MKAFDKELKEIQKQVVNAERHKNIIECVPKNKNNYYGSAINHILCDYEDLHIYFWKFYGCFVWLCCNNYV